jgi:hypothetical protein
MKTWMIAVTLLIGGGVGYGLACVHHVTEVPDPEHLAQRRPDFFVFPGAPWAEAELFHGWFARHDVHLPTDRGDLYLQISPRPSEDQIVLQVYKLTSPHGGRSVMTLEFKRSGTFENKWR